MTEKITIRRGRDGDSRAIARFNAEMALETEGLILDPATVFQGVRRALADENKAIYYVAEVAGEVVGQLMVTHEWSDWRDGDIWWVQSVYVAPVHRKKGVFRRLYEHARAEAKRFGAVGIRLYVEEENASAQETYRRLGMAMTHYRVMEEMWG